MKIEDLSKLWKILFYTWAFVDKSYFHKEFKQKITTPKIRLLHPIWFLAFILWIATYGAIEWFLNKWFIESIKNDFCLF